jgi:hypothetical protein
MPDSELDKATFAMLEAMFLDQAAKRNPKYRKAADEAIDRAWDQP